MGCDMSQEELDQRIGKLHLKITEDIARVGWSAISVFGGYPFTYTIGLTEMDHPELILYGISGQMAHILLAHAVNAVKDGAKFAHGDRFDKVLEGYEVEFRKHPIPPANWAQHFYGDDMSVLQMVWPDAEHRFPGEDGCEESCVVSQERQE